MPEPIHPGARAGDMTQTLQRRGSSPARGVREICYRFRYLNEAGRVVNCEDRKCAGDLAALVYARSLAPYHTVEIWDGARCVAYIVRGEDPLRIDDHAA